MPRRLRPGLEAILTPRWCVSVPQRERPVVVARDEGFRPDATVDSQLASAPYEGRGRHRG